MAAASIACIMLPALVSYPLLRVARIPWRVYLPALSFPNAGNLGLPICFFAFGQEGLSLGVMFFAAMAIGQFTSARRSPPEVQLSPARPDAGSLQRLLAF